ncbi:MAG TPA: SMI1/KNR4 family protein [Candidatus Acidoferrales bacterium]|nr:SMI1/KNR4 family protein [Candidatus Acidoferrales bacterium]
MPSQMLLIEVFAPLVVAFVLFVAASGARRFFHQLRHRMTPEQAQAARDSFRGRLMHPNAAEVEQRIGGLLPQRLLALYDDQETILTEEIEIRRPETGDGKDSSEWIEAFLPLDWESQEYTVDLSEHGAGKGFCFATDGAGNFYWVPVSDVRQPDAPVFFVCHDPFGNEQVASSLDAFLSWPRAAGSPETAK